MAARLEDQASSGQRIEWANEDRLAEMGEWLVGDSAKALNLMQAGNTILNRRSVDCMSALIAPTTAKLDRLSSSKNLSASSNMTMMRRDWSSLRAFAMRSCSFSGLP